jgi:hypothetical protein
MNVKMVKKNIVEREFWRIVYYIEEDVKVEYGEELKNMDNGYGFKKK